MRFDVGVGRGVVVLSGVEFGVGVWLAAGAVTGKKSGVIVGT